jgi:hypothetical protein
LGASTGITTGISEGILMPTRRQFLLNCAAAAVTASVAPTAALAVPVRFRELSLDEITFLDFAGKVNSWFQVQLESRRKVNLRLMAVRPATEGGLTAVNAGDFRNKKFSLLFAGEAGEPLP